MARHSQADTSRFPPERLKHLLCSADTSHGMTRKDPPVRDNDRRRHKRFPINGRVHVYWKDADGRDHVSIADVLNASVAGAQLQVEQPLPIGTFISCDDPERGHCGHGQVCYCSPVRSKYNIGLEFQPGQAGAVSDPIGPATL